MSEPLNYRQCERCGNCQHFRTHGILNFECVKYPEMNNMWGPEPEMVCDDWEEIEHES